MNGKAKVKKQKAKVKIKKFAAFADKLIKNE